MLPNIVAPLPHHCKMTEVSKLSQRWYNVKKSYITMLPQLSQQCCVNVMWLFWTDRDTTLPNCYMDVADLCHFQHSRNIATTLWEHIKTQWFHFPFQKYFSNSWYLLILISRNIIEFFPSAQPFRIQCLSDWKISRFENEARMSY